MKKYPFLLLLIYLAAIQNAYSQTSKGNIKPNWNYEDLYSVNGIDSSEVKWLQANLQIDEAHKLIYSISKLSRSSVSQLIPVYTIYDGSYLGQIMTQGIIDSLYQRPADGDAGIIHIAYLVSKVRMKVLTEKQLGEFYNSFNHLSLEIQPVTLPKNNVHLSFNFAPAKTILKILASPELTYDSVYNLISTHDFDEMIVHRNQSFYPFPFSREKMTYCLIKAASNEPIDDLYREMNPKGLLHYAEARAYLAEYNQVMETLEKNQELILDNVKKALLPYTPEKAMIDRKVSFFFGEGADGWASGDVTGLDLEYYKDDYKTLIKLLEHETFHTIQNAVAIANKTSTYVGLQHLLNQVFLEGTATFVAKSPEAYNETAEKGNQLFIEAIEAYEHKDMVKFQLLENEGFKGAGPFYSLGSEMTRVIISTMGVDKLKEILPFGGAVFFKTYFEALSENKSQKNLFNKDVELLIKHISNENNKKN